MVQDTIRIYAGRQLSGAACTDHTKGQTAADITIQTCWDADGLDLARVGIVRESALHQSACLRVESAVRGLGFATEMMESPILGAEGNKEFLLYVHH